MPQERPSIQAGVEAAGPGDLVLVGPGTYHEKVLIEKKRITIRGTDRNSVILDGQYTLQNGIEVATDGVVVENLTVRSYNGNGIFVNGAYSPNGVDKTKTYGSGADAIKGYRVSYVTSSNNGLYGIYAFAARGGQIDHSYVSGNPDSGLYVGQCKPCNVVLTDNIAETNSIGYFGTNASGGVYVVNSIFRANRLGLTPNTQKIEKLAPQAETMIAGNLIVSNGNTAAPPHPRGAIGDGVVLAGGTKDVVTKNRIVGNSAAGVLLTDLDGFAAESNTVEGNVLESNGIDLVYAPGRPVTAANCFRGNTFTSSQPASIESAINCSAPASTAVSTRPYTPKASTDGPSHKTVPLPPPQPSMPNAETAPVQPADDIIPKVDLATITVPSA